MAHLLTFLAIVQAFYLTEAFFQQPGQACTAGQCGPGFVCAYKADNRFTSATKTCQPLNLGGSCGNPFSFPGQIFFEYGRCYTMDTVPASCQGDRCGCNGGTCECGEGFIRYPPDGQRCLRKCYYPEVCRPGFDACLGGTVCKEVASELYRCKCPPGTIIWDQQCVPGNVPFAGDCGPTDGYCKTYLGKCIDGTCGCPQYYTYYEPTDECIYIGQGKVGFGQRCTTNDQCYWPTRTTSVFNFFTQIRYLSCITGSDGLPRCLCGNGCSPIFNGGIFNNAFGKRKR